MYVYNMKLFRAKGTFDERAPPSKICAYYKYIYIIYHMIMCIT